MIHIENLGNEVVLVDKNQNIFYKKEIVLNKDITLLPEQDINFDTQINIIVSESEELVYFEGNRIKENSCYLEDFIFGENPNGAHLILSISNETASEVILQKGKTLGILYKFINYRGDALIKPIYEEAEVVVGYRMNRPKKILKSTITENDPNKNHIVLTMEIEK